MSMKYREVPEPPIKPDLKELTDAHAMTTEEVFASQQSPLNERAETTPVQSVDKRNVQSI